MLLEALGHKAEKFDLDRPHAYDLIVFSKTYSAADQALARSTRARGARVVLDLCDNHFYNPYDLPRYRRARGEILEMISLSDRVVCTTGALAAAVRHETGGAVDPVVVGDVVERLKPRRRRRAAGEPLHLLWFGSHGSPNAPSGMADLLTIRDELESLAARTPVDLTICSNSATKYEELIRPLALSTRYREWSMEDFPEVIGAADAVILPLTLNPFTACKSHNRLTLSLYAGLPTLAVGIESYREFEAYCTLDDWAGGFDALSRNYEQERRRALASRAHIDSAWSDEAVALAWERALDLAPPAVRARPGRTRSAASSAGLFQGHLDIVAGHAITGWVRDLRAPRRRLEVVLECNGEVAGTTTTGLPRPDLRAVGMPDASCGFSLPLPEWCLGDRGSMRVTTNGWTIGEPPFLLTGVGVSLVPPTDAPPPDRTAPTPGADIPTPVVTKHSVESAVNAQQSLLRDVARIETLLEDFRRVAARAVVAFADSPELAERAHAALGAASPDSES